MKKELEKEDMIKEIYYENIIGIRQSKKLKEEILEDEESMIEVG